MLLKLSSTAFNSESPMFINRSIFAFGLVALMTGCVSGTIDLAGDTKSEELAIITTAERFYLFWGYGCGVMEADSVSIDSRNGAKTVKVPEGLHDLRIRCEFTHNHIVHGQNVYFGELTFLAQAGHEYTVHIQNMRKCIVIIDEENDAEVDSDCNLSGYSSPF